MDAARWSRAARRRLGLSQRAFAAVAGVSRAQVNAIESGRRNPSAHLVDRLLAAAGLDLMLCDRVGEQERDALVVHLRRSLTQRLRLALGDPLDLRSGPTSSAWTELVTLTASGPVVLEPPVALRLWLPTGPAAPLRVRLHQRRGELPATTTVTVSETDEPLPALMVPVALGRRRRVWVPPPAELALDRTADQLRLVDQLLHERAARDEADRRRPAHRDPDEPGEAWRLERTKGSERIVIPDGTDGRGWRLDAPASLAQLLWPDGRLLG